ncbi:polysaccharide deacetylase family protein [Halosimplex sp. TS25]|uniref:polysaccharide deacetylase family protein n=1 Tax=Halosimplex rarum TaxID=3396619 RepID=UPI0039EA25D5
MSRQTRRAFIGTVGALSVTGCLSSFRSGDTDSPDRDGVSTDDPLTNGTGTATASPTADETATPPNGTDAPTATATPTSPLDLSGEQLENFERFDRWFVLSDQGELSAETSDPYHGSQSARVESQSGDAFGGIYTAFDEPQDFSDRNLSLAVKVSKPDIAKISVALLAPDRGNMVRMMRTMPGPTDRWVRVDFGTTTVEREPDLSKVQEIRIVCRRRGGVDEPVEFAVDDLRAVDRPKKGRVMLTFDDAHESHYERAFPAMQEYGMAGVEGVIAAAVDNKDRLDVGMMRRMRDDGWDMASHPVTRGRLLTEFSEAKQKQRIEDNKRFLDRNGFREGARHFLTPQNMVGPNTYDIVREHHESLFTFGGMPNGLSPTTTYNFGRINGTDPSTVQQYVDYAEQYGQLVVLNHHAIGPEGISESDFRATLEYVDQADVEVVTASDLLDGDLGP